MALFYESRALVTFCTTSLTVNDQFFLVVMFNALHKVFLTFEFVDKYPSVYPRQSYILDSTPWIPDSRYWIADCNR